METLAVSRQNILSLLKNHKFPRLNHNQLVNFCSETSAKIWKMAYKEWPPPNPKAKLLELHQEVTETARIIDYSDPEYKFGYADIHNLFRPALNVTTEIEIRLSESGALTNELQEKIADIIFIFSRLGMFYYCGGRDNDHVELMLANVESALLRYQKLNLGNKIKTVENFIKRFPETTGTLAYLIKTLQKHAAISASNLNIFDKVYEIFTFGLKDFSSWGNYPLLFHLYSSASKELQKIGKPKEAEEWQKEAERMKKLARDILGVSVE